MSKAWERAMTVLDKDGETIEEETRPNPNVSLCWRCRKHPSRVRGEDFTCEGCLAWINGESDVDPVVPWKPVEPSGSTTWGDLSGRYRLGIPQTS